MSDGNRPIWNSLEVSKLAVGVATPLLLLFIGFMIDRSIHDAERAAGARQREAELAAQQQASVRELAHAMYDRRVRAELLSSSLRRHSNEPSPTSLEELKERKRHYDDTYAEWNAGLQANLLLVRQVLGQSAYTNFEDYITSRLVNRVLAPLDACLTAGYDAAIRGRDPQPFLEQCACRPAQGVVADGDCSVRALVLGSQECAYTITNALFLATFEPARRPAGDPDGMRQLNTRCPAPSQRDSMPQHSPEMGTHTVLSPEPASGQEPEP